MFLEILTLLHNIYFRLLREARKNCYSLSLLDAFRDRPERIF